MNQQKQAEAGAGLYPGLQIDEDFTFKRKEWMVERCGWLAMALLVVLACVGLFSNGLLSKTIVSDPGGNLKIEYERFQRFQSPSTIRVEILPSGGTNGVGLLFEEALMRDLHIETIYPPPGDTRLAGNGTVLHFPASSLPASIVMRVKPEAIGRIGGNIGLEGHAPARLSMFVYP